MLSRVLLFPVSDILSVQLRGHRRWRHGRLRGRQRQLSSGVRTPWEILGLLPTLVKSPATLPLTH